MRKLTILLTFLTLSAGLAQAQSVFYYTATRKLESQFSNLGTVISHEFDVNTNTGTVKYSGNVVSIPTDSFWACSELQSITLPACVTTIGSSAFGTCVNLQSINLSHVTYLGANAFNTCVELQFITLSENLTEIKPMVFSGCPSLTDVTVAWTEADKILAIDPSVFSGIANNRGPSGATLHVPAGTKALYETAHVWSTFGTIDDPASPYIAAAIAEIEAIATAAKAEIDDASTYEEVKTTQANYKSEIDATVSVAIYNINNATSIGIIDYELSQATTRINQIKTEALAEIAKINALVEARADAIAAINAKLEEIDNGNIKGIATIAIASINAATSVVEVNAIKTQALSNIAFAQGAYYDGKAEGIEKGKAEALGEMGEPCTDCPAVDVTKGTTTIRLYSPEKVEFRKME